MAAEDQFSIKSTRPSERRQVLLPAFGAFIVVFILWQVTAGSPLLFPFRLLVTFVHEMGHGLTAVLTGGNFHAFEIYGNGSGIAYTSGGSPFLIPQMGYLGAALFGSALLYATNRARQVNRVALVIGIFFIGCSLIFATRSRGDVTGMAGTIFALVIGTTSGIALIALGRRASPSITLFVLNALSFIIGFNAINDVWSLMSFRDARIGTTPNDAMAMAIYTHTPVELWIILWTGISIVMMGAAIYFALIRPMRVTTAV